MCSTHSNIYENNLHKLHVDYLAGCILWCNQLLTLSLETWNATNGLILWSPTPSFLPSSLHIFSSSVKICVSSTLHRLQWIHSQCLINCFKFFFYNNLATFMQLFGALCYFFLSYHKRNKAKLYSVPSVLCCHAASAEKGYWQIFKNISDRTEAIRIHRWFCYSCRREVAGTIHVGLVHVLNCVYRPHGL